MQFLCTMGILFVYPLYSIMYVSGMIVPRANSKCTFIAESYESMSLLFFLKLILTYMGGKKNAIKNMKGTKVHLNSPPFCCIPLPPIKFSAKFLFVNELLVVQLIVIELIMGYIDVLMRMDKSKSYPAALVEETYSHVFHGVSITSLCFAVYGLSSIYHSAEKQLHKFGIFRKFVCYKIVVTLAKLQDIVFSILSRNEVFGDLSQGAFTTHLRMHMWSSAITIIECTAIFQFAVKAFSPADYPSYEDNSRLTLSPRLIKRVAGEKKDVVMDMESDTMKLMAENDATQEERNILFLTDSLLSTISSSKFRNGMRCSKRVLSKFIDIRKYLPEFTNMDFIIIAAGINDILKFNVSPEFLMKFSYDFYEECSRICPGTKFIFSSLLPTNIEWANDVAEKYNCYIFELSLRFPNVIFFDNYQLQGRSVLTEDGIHITERGVCFVAKTLVKAPTNLVRCYNDPNSPWPLRSSFAEKALAFKATF